MYRVSGEAVNNEKRNLKILCYHGKITQSVKTVLINLYRCRYNAKHLSVNPDSDIPCSMAFPFDIIYIIFSKVLKKPEENIKHGVTSTVGQ